jgi:hypothetical protein
MPPTTTKEHQRERDRVRSARWRAAHPDRARAASNKSSRKRRQTKNPSDKPRVSRKVAAALETKQKEVRVNMLKSRLAYLRSKQNEET